jgi:hypothetical protein
MERVFYGGGRQCGKTTKMLQWMRGLTELSLRDESEPIPVMVCHTSERAMQLYRSTWDEDRNPTWASSWQFIGFDEVETYRPFHRNRVVLGFDDVDLLLHRFARHYPVGAWSATIS